MPHCRGWVVIDADEVAVLCLQEPAVLLIWLHLVAFGGVFPFFLVPNPRSTPSQETDCLIYDEAARNTIEASSVAASAGGNINRMAVHINTAPGANDRGSAWTPAQCLSMSTAH